ncbi:MAG: DUF624 domain-containing protein, partial [Bacillota bacterium]
RFFFLLATHPWKLVTLNLVFLMFSIPVVTIPAAVCGMSRVLVKLVREGNCFLWSEFIKEFKANLLKSLPFGLLSAVLLFMSYYALSVSTSSEDSGMSIFAGAIGLFILGLTLLFSSYVFVLLPSLELKNRYIAKNAIILMVTEWKTNFVIIGSIVVMALLIVAFFPYTVVLLLFIWFSLQQLIICTAVNETMQRRIIGPYEQSQKKGA